MNLQGKRLVLGMSGGIACYKVAELVRSLKKAGASVQVVMTDAAQHFITAVTMQALSGQTVYDSQWDARIANNMAHIDLTRDADAIIIAPASADFLGKLAHGLCDDLLSTLCMARPAHLPLLAAPAMNVEMWQNPALQRNLRLLQADGVLLAGPDAGAQACGEHGMGRMLEPPDLLQEIEALFMPKLLAGKRMLVTAGPTFEAIDPVRGITNLSSGKMGYAIARAARAAGAEVLLVSGPTALSAPYGVQRINVQSAQQMHDVTLSHIAAQDLFVAVAAVADWRVANSSEQKLKKDAAGKTPQLEFVQNPDILATVAALPQAPYCVGFAAESENLLEYGAQKRARKGVPLLVGNLGPQTFGQDHNSLVLFDADGHKAMGPADKKQLAQDLVLEIAQRFKAQA
ncbi:bifunctional phosphopantothenoylcysteine decarboxylase/phosphopantothenate--cysteine ligase CoaBC [Massilia sp. W12]|uniref:bifunctional phosphopantothenoylcysteine decarboxylase/phosphopantothenate--cysteine ligase CoaBC n=1 Tax=Massilia sp. W12 TaxID=3126507 RepID=UPI0030D27F1A